MRCNTSCTELCSRVHRRFANSMAYHQCHRQLRYICVADDLAPRFGAVLCAPRKPPGNVASCPGERAAGRCHCNCFRATPQASLLDRRLALVCRDAGPSDWFNPGGTARARRSLYLSSADWLVHRGHLADLRPHRVVAVSTCDSRVGCGH